MLFLSRGANERIKLRAACKGSKEDAFSKNNSAILEGLLACES